MFVAYWYGGNAAWPTGAKLVKHLRELKRHGVSAYMPQHALDEARTYIERHNVARVCADEGIALYLGLGLDRGRSTPTDQAHQHPCRGERGCMIRKTLTGRRSWKPLDRAPEWMKPGARALYHFIKSYHHGSPATIVGAPYRNAGGWFVPIVRDEDGRRIAAEIEGLDPIPQPTERPQ